MSPIAAYDTGTTAPTAPVTAKADNSNESKMQPSAVAAIARCQKWRSPLIRCAALSIGMPLPDRFLLALFHVTLDYFSGGDSTHAVTVEDIPRCCAGCRRNIIRDAAMRKEAYRT